jgi:glycosyltransferase involved in cell wall biosynthesis
MSHDGPPRPIPILVMSYNDHASLRLCLRAIVNRTRRDYRLIVVDNASTEPRLLRYLGLLARLTRIAVHRNRRNLWVLGLNAPLREALKDCRPDDLFAVSDCDIIVPPPRDGRCWLTRMETLMQQHACIGKLGLSLDLGYIQSRPAFAATLAAERFFLDGPRIGETIVAGVDTTMALYRQQLFVTRRPMFLPGHQSLLRPYYYCCRTTAALQAKHLSWRGYERRRDDDVAAKLRCMGLLGTAIAPAQVAAAPLGAQISYRLLLPLARLFWGSVVALLQGVYVARAFPRRANPLQHGRRGL